MKSCFKCQQIKPLSMFYKHPQMADGTLNKCKECARADSEARRTEKMKDPAWVESELKRHREKSAKYRSSGIFPSGEATRRAKATWEKRNTHKRKANQSLNNAVRDGRISKQPCEVCLNPDSEGHHEDYSRPLDVIWLCPKHHAERHVQTRKEKRLLHV